ncbi:MAG: ABC transporter substrate-binding protein, partial [Thermodesulfobacteriota bacterium]
MNRIVKMGSFILFVSVFAVAIALHPAGVKAQGPIKVGIIDTYTGPATTFTYDVRDAFKLAIDAVNAKGGALKRKIEFTTRDDKFK